MATSVSCSQVSVGSTRGSPRTMDCQPWLQSAEHGGMGISVRLLARAHATDKYRMDAGKRKSQPGLGITLTDLELSLTTTPLMAPDRTLMAMTCLSSSNPAVLLPKCRIGS